MGNSLFVNDRKSCFFLVNIDLYRRTCYNTVRRKKDDIYDENNSNFRIHPPGSPSCNTGGMMDAYSYIMRGHVFANAQTGNMLLFGVNLSEGNF